VSRTAERVGSSHAHSVTGRCRLLLLLPLQTNWRPPARACPTDTRVCACAIPTRSGTQLVDMKAGDIYIIPYDRVRRLVRQDTAVLI
jgi:hypothetical protein